jgi:hypothetical protein
MTTAQQSQDEYWLPSDLQAARQLGSKRVSVAMLLQVIGLPSHMACAQVPT